MCVIGVNTKGAIMTFKELMKKKGYTQTELAERIGVKQPTISGWVQGLNQPRTKQLPVIAQALGVSVSTLVKSFEQGA